MDPIEFTIPGEPTPKARPRVFQHRGRIITKTPDKTKAYEARVAAAFRSKAGPGWRPTIGSVELNLFFYRSTAHRVDLDNLIKSCLDALNGLAFVDDSQVVRITAEKFIDREQPRAMVQVRAARELR